MNYKKFAENIRNSKYNLMKHKYDFIKNKYNNLHDLNEEDLKSISNDEKNKLLFINILFIFLNLCMFSMIKIYNMLESKIYMIKRILNVEGTFLKDYNEYFIYLIFICSLFIILLLSIPNKYNFISIMNNYRVFNLILWGYLVIGLSIFYLYNFNIKSGENFAALDTYIIIWIFGILCSLLILVSTCAYFMVFLIISKLKKDNWNDLIINLIDIMYKLSEKNHPDQLNLDETKEIISIIDSISKNIKNMYKKLPINGDSYYLINEEMYKVGLNFMKYKMWICFPQNDTIDNLKNVITDYFNIVISKKIHYLFKLNKNEELEDFNIENLKTFRKRLKLKKILSTICFLILISIPLVLCTFICFYKNIDFKFNSLKGVFCGLLYFIWILICFVLFETNIIDSIKNIITSNIDKIKSKL